MSTIYYARSLWGMPGHSLGSNCRRIADGGFDAVEAHIPPGDPERVEQLRNALAETGLLLVAQVHTERDNLAQTKAQLDGDLTAAAGLQPLLVNLHTGSDHQDDDWNLELVDFAEDRARKHGFVLVHETHRGRATYNAATTLRLIQCRPDIRFCADFSHWCCVHESLLERHEREVGEVVARARIIHARVGHTQGPQVPHWRAPEARDALDRHLEWWDRIVESCRRSEEDVVICPEFGPAPYQPRLPFTDMPVSDNWELNHSMMRFLKDRYTGGDAATGSNGE